MVPMICNACDLPELISRSSFISLQPTRLVAFLRFFFLSRATPAAAYGSSQARDQIRAAAAGLTPQPHNMGSKLYLGPTPHLEATQDPKHIDLGQGLSLPSHRH